VAPAPGSSTLAPAPAGTVSGVVYDTSTGGRLAGVAVASGGHAATTDAGGAYTLSGLAAGTATISFTAQGHALGFATVDLGDHGVSAIVSLEPLGAAQPYDPTTSATIVETTDTGPYAVILDPGTLATTDTALTVSVTPLDPQRQLAALPGDLDVGGVMLTPLTFAEFTILDSKGNRVNLAAGSQAVVELPIPAELRATPEFASGQTIHCYSFDPTIGAWSDFVVGHVQASSVDGVTPVVRASVKHFSWYGAAVNWTKCHDVHGTVVSKLTGKPLGGAEVMAFPGGSATTDASGDFTLKVPMGRGNDGPTYVAFQQYIDQDGSVSGTPGATVIEYGDVPPLSLTPGLVPTSCTGVPMAGSDPPVIIDVGKLGSAAYRTSASMNGGAISVGVLTLGPNGMPNGTASNSAVTVTGPDGVAHPLSGIDGNFTGAVTLKPGQRYTVAIDADGDGVIDGGGSILVPGALAIASPAAGSSTSATGLVVKWSDSGAAASGYSAWYHVGVGNTAGGDRADFIGYAPSLQFAATSAKNPGTPLTPGHYSALVQAYTGPVPGTPSAFNIEGPTVSGAFSAYSDSQPAIEFDLTP
jgi:hypothetical protein